MPPHPKRSPIWAQPQLGAADAETPMPAQQGEHRLKVLALLDAALATELVAMLRCRRHHFMARSAQTRSTGPQLLAHAAQALQNADWLAERIAQLGGEPDFAPDSLMQRSHAPYVEGDSLEAMRREDLLAGRIAIDGYRSFIRFLGGRDPTTRQLLERILAAEEAHAEALAAQRPPVPGHRREDIDAAPGRWR